MKTVIFHIGLHHLDDRDSGNGSGFGGCFQPWLQLARTAREPRLA